jgi:hypothetical protein
MKFRWRARVYPELENEVDLPIQPVDLRAPYKTRWAWQARSRNVNSGHVLIAVRLGRQPCDAALSQQEKNNSADAQWGSVNTTGVFCTV